MHPSHNLTPHASHANRSALEASDPAMELNWGGYRAHGFERHHIDTSVGRMSFHEAGRGQPMVFLHGLGGGASSWSWSSVAPRFLATHRVVVPDLVGWGLSEHPQRFVLFDDYVSAIEALLSHLGGGAVVVAQSLAAGFALAVAEKRPDLIARLVLTNPTGLRDFGNSGFPLVFKLILLPLTKTPGVRMAFYKALFHRRSFMANWYETQGFSDASAVPPELIDGALYSATRPNAAYSALPFVTGDVHYDIVPFLRRVAVPTSMIVGTDPGFIGVRNARRLQTVRPDIATYPIERSKACVESERPEATAEAIQAALRR